MTFDTEDYGFPLSRHHDPFPSLLVHVFELLDVMDFEESPFFSTVFTDMRFEPLFEGTPIRAELAFPYKDFNLYPCDFPAYTL